MTTAYLLLAVAVGFSGGACADGLMFIRAVAEWQRRALLAENQLVCRDAEIKALQADVDRALLQLNDANRDNLQMISQIRRMNERF